jgi:hypothetical protein
MYRGGSTGTCDQMPLTQVLLLTFSMVAYGICIWIYFFRYDYYMHHVYDVLVAGLDLIMPDPLHRDTRAFRAMVRRTQFFPLTGLFLGQQEIYLPKMGMHKQRVLAWVSVALSTPCFVFVRIWNLAWGCYGQFSMTVGNREILNYGMCWFDGHHDTFDGFTGDATGEIPWSIGGASGTINTGIKMKYWKSMVVLCAMCVIACIYWICLILLRVYGLRINKHVLVHRFEDAYVECVRVYVALEKHTAPGCQNPALMVALHAVGPIHMDDVPVDASDAAMVAHIHA